MGKRVPQVSLAEVAGVREVHRELFGECDAAAQPGTATGTRGDYWTTYALVPDILHGLARQLLAILQSDGRWSRVIGSSRFGAPGLRRLEM